MQSRTTLPTILLLAVLLAGCPKPQLVREFSDPAAFARNLFQIAREGGKREWATQLTAERRAMGDAYIAQHFENWRTILVQLETSFGVPVEEVSFRLNDNGLEFEFDKKWHLLIRVAAEPGGALKINQD